MAADSGGCSGGGMLEMSELSFASVEDERQLAHAGLMMMVDSYGHSRMTRAFADPDPVPTGGLASKDQRSYFLKSYLNGEMQIERPTGRDKARRLSVSAPWLGLQLATILLDVTTIVLRSVADFCLLCDPEGHIGGKSLALGICLVFCLDLMIRMYGFGSRVFCSHWWNILDGVIVVLTTLATLLAVAGVGLFRFDKAGFLRILRFIRVVRMLRATTVISRMSLACCSLMRHVTGENKRRFVSLEDDIDLDLVYITPRLVSMSVPASDWITRLYRNPLPDVVRFFERFHRGHYMIANLCPELPYPPSAFPSGQVHCFNVKDHSPPLVSDIVRFLGLAQEWTAKDRDNIVAVHCRGGKGRTGSFCCAWLLYSREAEDAQDALNFFALRRTDMEQRRTKKVQGVETPSQVRCVEYIERLLREQSAFQPAPVQPPAPVSRRLLTLTAHGFFRPGGPQEMVAVVHDAESHRVIFVSQPDSQVWDLGGTVVREDTRISVFGRGKLPPGADLQESYKGVFAKAGKTPSKPKGSGREPGCLFYFLFHTAFLDGRELCLPLAMVDKACRNSDRYHEEGCLVLAFADG